MVKRKSISKKAKEILDESGLTEKNKVFCREYVYDWNATRSYKVAYPDVKSDDVAAAASSRLLSNVKIKAYCDEIQKDLEKLCGISRAKILNEHLKLAYSSIAHLHNTWVKRKDFENLTEDQKSCIAEISTQIKVGRNVSGELVENEYIKIKLYDKQKALEAISKMLGYDAPVKMQLGLDFENMPDIIIKAND